MPFRAVGCALGYLLLDVIISTVLYIHGSHLSIIKEEVLNFSVLCSLLDVWATVLLRCALLLGACMGVSWNREEGPRRVLKATPAVVLMCLVTITYALAKLLLLTELRPLSQQPWALSLLCWTFASAPGLLLPWRLLGEASTPTRGHGGRSGSEDTEKLLDGQRPAEGSQPDSGATLGRLLAYSRQDGGLLSVAVLFLLVSAVCKCDLGSGARSPQPSTVPEYFTKLLTAQLLRWLTTVNHTDEPTGCVSADLT